MWNLDEINALDPQWQYHFLYSGNHMWLLVEEHLVGAFRHQKIIHDGMDDASFEEFFRHKMGNRAFNGKVMDSNG